MASYGIGPRVMCEQLLEIQTTRKGNYVAKVCLSI